MDQHAIHRIGVCALLVMMVTSVAFIGASMATPSMERTGPSAERTGVYAQTGANGTGSNASGQGATIELDNSSSTTPTEIIVSNVRLPEGGFVTIHGPGYSQGGIVIGSEIATSRYLSPGSYEDLRIRVSNGVPGSNLGTIQQLNLTRGNISAVAYRDANGNKEFDFFSSFGEQDAPYQNRDDTRVVDTEYVEFEGNIQQKEANSQIAPGAIRFNDQQPQFTNGKPTVIVRSVNVSEGGFVTIHNESYLSERQPFDSVIATSEYLTPGTHQNIAIELPNGSLNQTRTLVAVPYMDTNSNQGYEYVKSGGETDFAYISQKDGSNVIVNDTATIRVSRSQGGEGSQSSATGSQNRSGSSDGTQAASGEGVAGNGTGAEVGDANATETQQNVGDATTGRTDVASGGESSRNGDAGSTNGTQVSSGDGERVISRETTDSETQMSSGETGTGSGLIFGQNPLVLAFVVGIVTMIGLVGARRLVNGGN